MAPTTPGSPGLVGGQTTKDDERRFFPLPLAKVEANLEAAQAALTALHGGGNYSGDFIAIAAREHDQRIASQSRVVAAWSGICGQVVATIYDLAVEIYHELLFSELQIYHELLFSELQIYHELLFSELQATLFAEIQTSVDGSLSNASGAALDKIERVSDRLRDGDPESVSQALTTCRRLIDSCSDHLFPSRNDPYDLGDGTNLNVGQRHVLNRLQAYCHAQGITKSRRDRLRRSLSDLYGRCSAGTHAEVTVQEARFVFLQTYIALGELLNLAEQG